MGPTQTSDEAGEARKASECFAVVVFFISGRLVEQWSSGQDGSLQLSRHQKDSKEHFISQRGGSASFSIRVCL